MGEAKDYKILNVDYAGGDVNVYSGEARYDSRMAAYMAMVERAKALKAHEENWAMGYGKKGTFDIRENFDKESCLVTGLFPDKNGGHVETLYLLSVKEGDYRV